MMKTSLTLNLLIMLLVTPVGLVTGIVAQEDPTIPNTKTNDTKDDRHSQTSFESPTRSRARDLAVSTAFDALTWDDHLGAVRVLARVADLLWKDNPDRARKWLIRAWELTYDIPNDNPARSSGKYRSKSPQARARTTVLVAARCHDKSLADRFLMQLDTEEVQARYQSSRGIFDDRTARSEQLLQMALIIVESNTAMAAELAIQSLVDGVSFQLQRVLHELRMRDVVAASRVFDVALARLQVSGGDYNEGQIIASYLFTPGRILTVDHNNTVSLSLTNKTHGSQKTPAEMDPDRARRFLTIMQRIFLSSRVPSSTVNASSEAQEFVTLANLLASGFRIYAPELWLPIEQRLAETVFAMSPAKINSRLQERTKEKSLLSGPGGRTDKDLYELYIDELEEIAERESTPIARKLSYVKVALATTPQDLMRGKRLASKIDDDELREQVLSFLLYRAALVRLEEGHLDEAVNLASTAKAVQHAIIKITAAQQLISQNADKANEYRTNARFRALNLLSDVEKVLSRDNDSDEVLRTRLGFIAALASLDSFRALNSFSNLIVTINKSDSFDPYDTSAPRISGFDAFSMGLFLPRIRTGYGLKDALIPLSRAHFDLAVYTVEKLRAPSVRGVCMLMIAESVLTGQTKGDSTPHEVSMLPALQQ